MGRTELNPGAGARPATEGGLDPYRRAISHYPWVVVVALVVAVGVAAAYLSQRSATYEATAQILVTPVAGEAAPAGLPVLTESVDPTRTLQTAASVLRNPRAVQIARQATNGEATIDDVRIEPLGDSNVIAVTASADSPAAAARLADAYARGALQARRESLREQVEGQLRLARARSEAVDADADPASASVAAARVQALEELREGADPNFSLLQSADAPTAASGAAAWMVIALALFAGGAVGVGAALLLEQLDGRLRDEEDLVQLAPLPVLARVPLEKRTSRDDPLPEPTLEAFRSLTVHLEARAAHSSRVVLVTSASEGDGKTSSAIGLAGALASAGRRVVLLDLDVHKGDVSWRLHVHTDVMRLVQTQGQLSDWLVPAPAEHDLLVLSAPPGIDPDGLVHGLARRLPELVEQARSIGDFVVIDTPPLGRVSDAVRLLALADDVLLVGRPARTRRRELDLTLERLAQLDVRPAGWILVGGRRRRGYDGSPRRRLVTGGVDAAGARPAQARGGAVSPHDRAGAAS